MFRTRKSKTYFKDKVKKLMREKKNKKLKSLIENEDTYPSLKDGTGTTLLHMAARYNNVQMMKYSIDSGCQIDAKNASGTTPLMIATKYNHFSAMKILLDANADVLTTDSTGESSLRLAFDRERKVVYPSIIKNFCGKVKSSSSSVEEATQTFLTARFSLSLAAVLQDTEVTRIFLEKVETIDDEMAYKSVLFSMLFIDSANLKILLCHGSQVAVRVLGFFRYLHDMTQRQIVQKCQEKYYGQSKTLETVRTFAKKIVEWKLLKEENLKYIKFIFEDADKNILREFLNSDIVSHVKSDLGYNLLPHVYGNRNPGVIELLQNAEFKLEARGSTRQPGVTALHVAAYRCVPNSVKLLLDMGANPNAVDADGETPLFGVLNSDQPLKCKIECVIFLLKSNADVEVCDNTGQSFIEYVALDNTDHLALAEPVLAHLAMLVAIDSPVKKSTVEYINAHDELKNRYETCQRQLEEMKTRKVARYFSLFTMLTSSPDKIARFVGAQVGKIIATRLRDSNLRELNEYYSKKFKCNLDRAFKVNELRCKVDNLIVENITSFCNYNPVVDHIISYFNFEELLAFDK